MVGSKQEILRDNSRFGKAEKLVNNGERLLGEGKPQQAAKSFAKAVEFLDVLNTRFVSEEAVSKIKEAAKAGLEKTASGNAAVMPCPDSENSSNDTQRSQDAVYVNAEMIPPDDVTFFEVAKGRLGFLPRIKSKIASSAINGVCRLWGAVGTFLGVILGVSIVLSRMCFMQLGLLIEMLGRFIMLIGCAMLFSGLYKFTILGISKELLVIYGFALIIIGSIPRDYWKTCTQIIQLLSALVAAAVLRIASVLDNFENKVVVWWTLAKTDVNVYQKISRLKALMRSVWRAALIFAGISALITVGSGLLTVSGAQSIMSPDYLSGVPGAIAAVLIASGYATYSPSSEMGVKTLLRHLEEEGGLSVLLEYMLWLFRGLLTEYLSVFTPSFWRNYSKNLFVPWFQSYSYCLPCLIFSPGA